MKIKFYLILLLIVFFQKSYTSDFIKILDFSTISAYGITLLGVGWYFFKDSQLNKYQKILLKAKIMSNDEDALIAQDLMRAYKEEYEKKHLTSYGMTEDIQEVFKIKIEYCSDNRSLLPLQTVGIGILVYFLLHGIKTLL